MMPFLIVVVVLLAVLAAWRLRVPLLARILGQSPSRVDRALNRRRR